VESHCASERRLLKKESEGRKQSDRAAETRRKTSTGRPALDGGVSNSDRVRVRRVTSCDILTSVRLFSGKKEEKEDESPKEGSVERTPNDRRRFSREKTPSAHPAPCPAIPAASRRLDGHWPAASSDSVYYARQTRAGFEYARRRGINDSVPAVLRKGGTSDPPRDQRSCPSRAIHSPRQRSVATDIYYVVLRVPRGKTQRYVEQRHRWERDHPWIGRFVVIVERVRNRDPARGGCGNTRRRCLHVGELRATSCQWCRGCRQGHPQRCWTWTMAGKPEQPSTLPAPPSHGYQYQHHHHHHHHHQQQVQQQQAQQPQLPPQQHHYHQQQQQQSHHSQQPQAIQQNSVLVYVSGENFAYATAVGQNVAATAAAAIAVGYQSQPQQQQQQQTTTQYAGILQAPQVATAQAVATTFPAKTAVYCADDGSSGVNVGNNTTTTAITPAIGCCRLKPSLETTTTTTAAVVNTSTDGSESRHAPSLHNEDEEDYAMLYRQANLGHSTTVCVTATTTTAMMTRVAASRENKRPSENGERSTADSLGNNGNDSMISGAKTYQTARLQHSGDAYSARMSGEYNAITNNNRIVARPNSSDVGLLGGDDDCVAYGTSTSVGGSNGIALRNAGEQQAATNVDDKNRQQDGFDNQQVASSTPTSALIGDGSVGVGSGAGVAAAIGGCDSVRSDESSTTYSSLSSPDESRNNQPGQHDGGMSTSNNYPGGGSACAQQAARQQPSSRVNGGNNNGVQHNAMVLTMNGSAVITQQQHQQQQQPSAITVPRGWKRICTNGVIIYIRWVPDVNYYQWSMILDLFRELHYREKQKGKRLFGETLLAQFSTRYVHVC